MLVSLLVVFTVSGRMRAGTSQSSWVLVALLFFLGHSKETMEAGVNTTVFDFRLAGISARLARPSTLACPSTWVMAK